LLTVSDTNTEDTHTFTYTVDGQAEGTFDWVEATTNSATE
jgi:hypothetical protein